MEKESFAFNGLSLLMIAVMFTLQLPGAMASEDVGVFARVDDVVITREEFEREVYSAARQTFYHGRPPSDEELIEFRRNVAEEMIDRTLLLKEARRRNLEPNDERIEARIAAYESRYGDTERWRAKGAEMVATLRAHFEEDSLMDALEADVRSASPPDEAELRAYYDANPDLFTEPSRNRVSLILMGVAPSAQPALWEDAQEEAERVLERLDEGISFEELAKRHSSDSSASAGGDMGYLHQGMLSVNAEQAIAELSVGGVSEPVQVLEGIAIFKLTEQQPARLRSFDDVRERASELWLRDKGDREWEMLVARLRSDSWISVDTDYLVSVPGTAR